jgi:uncharacterized protein with LGFP repeats
MGASKRLRPAGYLIAFLSIATVLVVAGLVYFFPRNRGYGAIHEKWIQLGADRGFGAQISKESPSAHGRVLYFTDGKAIYWSEATGAHEGARPHFKNLPRGRCGRKLSWPFFKR